MKYFLILLFSLLFPLFVHSQTNCSDNIIKARQYFNSGFYDSSLVAYHTIDSAGELNDYFDLYRYYLLLERNDDSLMVMEQLFNLVKSNGFDRHDLPENIGLTSRSYWPQIDSIITVRETYIQQHYIGFIDTLNALVKADQEIRMIPNSPDVSMRMHIIDSSNFCTLVRMIEKYGFPTWSMVGKEISDKAWLIAQHADRWSSYGFYQQYKKAVENHDASAYNLAKMEDRQRLWKGLPQLYGTHQSIHHEGDSTITTSYYIGDPCNLDRRRACMELSSYSSLCKRMGIENISIEEIDYSNYYSDCVSPLLQNSIYDFYGANFYNNIALRYYPFPKDYALFSSVYWHQGDTAKALYCAEGIIQCGGSLEDCEQLPQLIQDSMRVRYPILRLDYEQQLSKAIGLVFDTISSFEHLKQLLDTGHYPRYEIDAWLNRIPALIAQKAETIDTEEFKPFFNWLYSQVKKGNYYLDEYAKLYDIAYNRLFGGIFYGQHQPLLSDEIENFEQIEKRRAEIGLISLSALLRQYGIK